MKPKKKGIKIRSLPRRQSGEVSFRTLDQIQRQSSYNNALFQNPRNQRWVHLPSFDCLIPCKSACVCENDKGDGKEVVNQVVVVQENAKKEQDQLPLRSARRHVFDRIEIKDEGLKDMEEKNLSIPPKNALLLMRSRSDPVKMDEEKNVSVPPKNALLLMRCRSDPVKMEALVNRCWEPQLPKQVEEDDDEEVVEDSDENILVDVKNVEIEDEKVSEEEETEGVKRLVVDEESEEEDDEGIEATRDKNEDESRVSYSNASFSLQSDDDLSEPDDDDDEEIATLYEEETSSHVKILEEKTEELERENEAKTMVKRESEEVVKKEETRGSKLPDCLLLMMCEPKLSMEVSKETWVCDRGFVEEKGKVDKVSVECNAKQHWPLTKPSCTFPASMAAMIEHKLLNAAAYEPFVLTRCKSAPIRTAGAIQLVPDGWFWKNEGLQKHRRGGFGAAELVAFQLSR